LKRRRAHRKDLKRDSKTFQDNGGEKGLGGDPKENGGREYKGWKQKEWFCQNKTGSERVKGTHTLGIEKSKNRQGMNTSGVVERRRTGLVVYGGDRKGGVG